MITFLFDHMPVKMRLHNIHVQYTCNLAVVNIIYRSSLCLSLYAVQRNEQKSVLDEEREKWRTEKCSLLAEIKLFKGRSLSPVPTPTLTTSNENSGTNSPDDCLETSMLRVSTCS